MLILLPPSEGKLAPARGRTLRPERLSSPGLMPARGQVLDALVELCATDPDQAAKVLGLGSTQLDLVSRNARLPEAPTARADRVYTGVLYDALGFADLSTAAKRRAASRVAITSSLFGVLRPGDHIPSYRLSGDTTLPGIGPIAGFWRDHLAGPMRELVGSGLLVDLRSSTYTTFWRPEPDLASRVATVRVLHEQNGTRKVVSHFNKATKGRLVRAVLEDGGRPRSPAALADLLRGLGWKVEEAAADAKGTRLDVVVESL